MSGTENPNIEHYAYEQAAEFNHFLLKQNWTSGILREEAAVFDEMVTGRYQPPDYRVVTETQRAYGNPNKKSIQDLKHIEENRIGRHAYTPNRNPPLGVLPTFNAKAYPDVVPRFNLPKMPH